MATPKPTLAFFGATGGCALSTLALALKDGYNSVALARTPSKLTKLLTEQHGLSQSTLDTHLTIISGSATDAATLKTVLSHNAAYIISGLGSGGKLQLSLRHPFLIDQPTICTDGASAILSALQDLDAEGKLTTKPTFVAISTTGMSKKKRDVPLLFWPLYHWLLAVPHIDKTGMEDAIAESGLSSPSPLSGFVIVRASLLTDGSGIGVDKLRVGWERHERDGTGEAGPGPAVGYTVARKDVGAWIFEKVVKNADGEWNGRLVTVTS